MSIFSYAFGGAVIFSNDDSKVSGRKKFIGPQNNFGSSMIDSASYGIIRELRRYSPTYQESTARFLMDIPGSQFLNTRMLVAAYFWFNGNESPDVFTPDMFTMSNSSFAEITEKSYPDEKEWKRDHLISLITYAMLIRRNQREINTKHTERLIRDHESSDESDYYEEQDDESSPEFEEEYD